MTERKYVVIIDGDYYAGANKKYSDMYNISGSGAIGAKQMDYETAEKIREYYEQIGRNASIEEYNPHRYIKDALEKIIRCDEEQRDGKDVGYIIRNLAQKCLKFMTSLE